MDNPNRKKRKLRINEFHRRYFKMLKQKALEYEKLLGTTIKNYKRAQERFAKRPFQLSSPEELFTAIKSAQIIYLGDFHTFDQSIKNLKRILKLLYSNANNDLYLGLELISSDKQEVLDNYLKQNITEEQFLKQIEYSHSWNFPWSHYKIIFDFAIENHIPIVALNSSGTLAQRDNHAAQKIHCHFKQLPNSKLLVLFGELHIIPSKLPHKVKKRCPNIKELIIHQNLDEVFWQLKRQGENSEVIKFSPTEFSLQTSPPWLKYESMIFWYEHLSEDSASEAQNFMIETGKLLFNDDIYDNFIFLVKKIQDSLNIKPELTNLDDYTLYDFDNLADALQQIEEKTPSSLQIVLQKILQAGEFVSIPNSKSYYCASYTITRIAYLAGIHLYKCYAPTKNIITTKRVNKVFVFVLFFKEAFFGYLGSKIVNPSHKCNMYLDFQKLITQKANSRLTKRDTKIAQQIITILQDENQLHPLITHNSHLFNFFFAKQFAHFTAELLYQDLNSTLIKKFNEHITTIINDRNDLTSMLKIITMIKNRPYRKSQKPYF